MPFLEMKMRQWYRRKNSQQYPQRANETPEQRIARTLIEFDFADSISAQPITVAPVDEAARTSTPTFADIIAAQAECPDFASIIAYLKDGTLPQDVKQARRIVAESQDFVIENRALYHLFTPRTKRLHRAYAVIKQICIATQHRRCIATELHDHVAHPGFDRVFSMARMRYYWPGMYTYLRDHVLTCATCQKCKREIHPPTVPVGELPAALPLTRFHMDFFGPLRESDGKRFILVIVDSASQWPELIATDNLEAKTICEALFNNVVSRFGLPRSISVVSDNGSGFTSALAETFAKTYGIKQYFTSPYHKQANSRAEHFGETIHKSLKILCEQQADWSKHLQAVAMYYRYAPTTNLGLSPFEIIYGRTMIQNLDWDLVANEPPVLRSATIRL
jgi:transposase InsO family protein